MTVAAAAATSTSSTAADQAAVSSAAASSLQLLLREDPLLVQYGLTESSSSSSSSSPADDVAFAYAAALLQQDDDDDDDDDYDDALGAPGRSNKSSRTTGSMDAQRADFALQDVERKLALVESLAVKLSRTSPESVASHLLRLHGHYVIQQAETGTSATQGAASTSLSSSSSLQSVRERAARLERQAVTLETVATRVQGSLQRGLERLCMTCTRLQRVLSLSSTLKHILRLQFENVKLQNYDLDTTTAAHHHAIVGHDLVRAAASVAVLEDLLSRGEFLQPPPTTLSFQADDDDDDKSATTIAVVEQLRPRALQTAALVRQAAHELLQQYYEQQQQQQQQSNSMQTAQLGSTLQVFFHLGELPQAVWKAVDHAHAQAESISRDLWNPVALQNLHEQARQLQGGSSAKSSKALQQLRMEAAERWATGIADAALQVQNLQRVLCYKTDPVSRQVFIHVVARAPIPRAYQVIINKNSSSSSSSSGSKKTTTTAAAGATTASSTESNISFSLFALFWQRYCRSLGTIIQSVMAHDHGKLVPDHVAALYPAARGVSKDLIGRLLENSHFNSIGAAAAVSAAVGYEDVGTVVATGILGGSSILDDAFLEWDNNNITTLSSAALENPQEATATTTTTTTTTRTMAADSWTMRAPETAVAGGILSATAHHSSSSSSSRSSSAAALSAVVQSTEWKALQGTESDPTLGFYPLQQAFVKACTQRLCEPLQ
jgi:conserved oligomeric Golgi complex subunit 5